MKIKHNQKKLRQLHQMRNKIHLNPAWQRGAVWSAPKRSLLIDSILRGYDVPMIYLRKCPPSGAYQYEVVDGQQRLRAIWDYVDGVFTLSKNSEKIGNIIVANKCFEDLPNSAQKRIKEFPIIVAEISNAGEPEISRLFSRLQMGVRLNSAELRNAIQSGLRHAIDLLARSHPFFDQSRISASRFKHQDYLAHVFSICFHTAKRDLKAAQLTEDYNEIDDASDYAPLIADCDVILDFLARVNGHSSKRIVQKWIFVDLFFLLYQNKSKLKQLSTTDFTDIYVDFDEARRAYNAEPEALLVGKVSQRDRDLYDYISAFKISGGERKNLQTRNSVIQRRFAKLLGI